MGRNDINNLMAEKLKRIAVYIFICCLSAGSVRSHVIADTIAFYNAKYNSTCLVSLREYAYQMNVLLENDTVFANECLAHIVAKAKEVKRKGDYAYLAPQYYVNLAHYNKQAHALKMEKILSSLFRQQKYKILLNGQVFTSKDVKMKKTRLYCCNNIVCGKKVVLLTMNGNKRLYEAAVSYNRNTFKPRSCF
jgi:hypothetical protein